MNGTPNGKCQVLSSTQLPCLGALSDFEVPANPFPHSTAFHLPPSPCSPAAPASPAVICVSCGRRAGLDLAACQRNSIASQPAIDIQPQHHHRLESHGRNASSHSQCRQCRVAQPIEPPFSWHSLSLFLTPVSSNQNPYTTNGTSRHKHTWHTPIAHRTPHAPHTIRTLHIVTTPPNANTGRAPLSLFNGGCARRHDARPSTADICRSATRGLYLFDGVLSSVPLTLAGVTVTHPPLRTRPPLPPSHSIPFPWLWGRTSREALRNRLCLAWPWTMDDSERKRRGSRGSVP
ncbi:hypothetical protein BDP55DRAFT_627138 [Colletotrichum godetiae]|uniref:Uncharacterized protein n=1 Tax=Colletotrichum godetiae TaxID=1209918 RepID=A0AAJ0EYW2_9PEZI|nr:uncharacterized protein BDP55DRAFT_627138 [Colletotrichum godetiae]KAK1691480.1 hypothetical protein BDP55DRAFT_627138 [Colletotrichum godetiae]